MPSRTPEEWFEHMIKKEVTRMMDAENIVNVVTFLSDENAYDECYYVVLSINGQSFATTLKDNPMVRHAHPGISKRDSIRRLIRDWVAKLIADEVVRGLPMAQLKG